MPRAHRIKQNHTTGIPTCHIFLDCEAWQKKDEGSHTTDMTLRLWCASSIRFEKGTPTRRIEAQGHTREEFWTWLRFATRGRRAATLWMHNAGVDLSWIGFWSLCDKGEYCIRWCVLEDPPTIIRGSLDKLSLTVLDSLNFFHSSLADLGLYHGCEKLSLPAQEESDEIWFEYCRRDVSILEKSVVSLCQWALENDLGHLKFTAAGQAWQTWRHLYKGPGVCPHGSAEIAKMERQAYYGGRCDCFFVGKAGASCVTSPFAGIENRDSHATFYTDEIYSLDAKAFYPHIMRENEYPVKFLFATNNSSVDKLKYNLEKYAVLAHCKIRSDGDVYPYRHKGRTIYVQGSFWTWLAGPEIQHAFQRDQIIDVGEMLIYEKGDVFSTFVNKLWQLRVKYEEEANEPWRRLCKLIMNSLYGRFGRHGGGWKTSDTLPVLKRWGTWWLVTKPGEKPIKLRGVAGKTQVYIEQAEHDDSFVAIPAYVTSYGRVMMQELINQLPVRSVLYMDTDGFHCTREAYQWLLENDWIDSCSPGKLAVKEVWENVRYYNAKVYRADEREVVAGLPQKAVRDAQGSYHFEVWERLGSIIERGPDGHVLSWERISNLSGDYLRGIVGTDGFVVPYCVGDSL